MTDESNKNLVGAVVVTVVFIIIGLVAAMVISRTFRLDPNYTGFISLIGAIMGLFIGIIHSSLVYGPTPISEKCSHERCVNKAETGSEFCKDCVPMGAQECSGCNRGKS